MLGGIERMRNSDMRLVVCLALFTIGVALILLGIRWLSFAGLACAVSSSFFSQRQRRNHGRYIVLLFCLVGIVLDFMDGWRDGSIFKRKPLEIWWWAIFIGAWLWAVIDESRRWWSSRRVIELFEKKG